MRKTIVLGLYLLAARFASADPAASIAEPTGAAVNRRSGGDATGAVEGVIRYAGAKKPGPAVVVPAAMSWW